MVMVRMLYLGGAIMGTRTSEALSSPVLEVIPRPSAKMRASSMFFIQIFCNILSVRISLTLG